MLASMGYRGVSPVPNCFGVDPINAKRAVSLAHTEAIDMVM